MPEQRRFARRAGAQHDDEDQRGEQKKNQNRSDDVEDPLAEVIERTVVGVFGCDAGDVAGIVAAAGDRNDVKVPVLGGVG